MLYSPLESNLFYFQTFMLKKMSAFTCIGKNAVV